MAARTGRFDWCELMTTDAAAAEGFYREVIGWGAQPAPGGIPYTLLTAGEVPVAGMMAMPAEAAGMPPFWHGYVTVNDLDAALEKAASLGGTLVKPAMDMPGVGRFAPVADPQGAILSVAQWEGGAAETPDVDPMSPLHIGWKELATSDCQAAFDYYAALFGWQHLDSVDLGAMGSYMLFGLDGRAFGGMFNRPPQMPVSAWAYYVSVANVRATHDRAVAHGASVLNGPMEVPGGMWIVQFRDPQGAFFAIVGPKGD